MRYSTGATQPDPRVDRGFTLIELVIVLVLLGVLATVAVSAVFDFHGDADATSCDADARTLLTAAEAFKAQRGVLLLPATGGGPDRFETTLVEDGLLRTASSLYDLDEDGMLVVVAGSPCGLG